MNTFTYIVCMTLLSFGQTATLRPEAPTTDYVANFLATPSPTESDETEVTGINPLSVPETQVTTTVPTLTELTGTPRVPNGLTSPENLVDFLVIPPPTPSSKNHRNVKGHRNHRGHGKHQSHKTTVTPRHAHVFHGNLAPTVNPDTSRGNMIVGLAKVIAEDFVKAFVNIVPRNDTTNTTTTASTTSTTSTENTTSATNTANTTSTESTENTTSTTNVTNATSKGIMLGAAITTIILQSILTTIMVIESVN